jgi:hypothetical protein
MPNVKEDQQALDWLAANPNDQRAPQVAKVLGVGPEEVKAWQWTKDNPADMRAVQVRNSVYDKVAESRPSVVDEQGGEVRSVGGVNVPVDRLVVKNLLEGDQEAQRAYFEKKGFRTRISQKGEIQAKAPGETYYKSIDPEGIDLWDASDLIGDALAGVATGASATKTVGGPVGVVLGSVAGGLAGAGVELGKQSIANLVGVRSDYNPYEVAKAGLIGATVPPALDLLGAALKGTGKVIGSVVKNLTGSSLKETAPEIEAATKEIGGKATPGQLFEGEVVKKLEDTQRQSAGLIGGTQLRKQIDKNYKASIATAEDLVAEATGKTSREVGDEIGAKLTAAVTERLAPAEAIYQKYEAKLANAPLELGPDGEELSGMVQKFFGEHGSEEAGALPSTPIQEAFTKVAKDHQLSPDANAAVLKFAGVIDKVKTIGQLKELGSSVGAAARVADANNNWPVAQALRDLQGEIRDVKSQSIINYFDRVNPGQGDIVKAELQSADKIYRETIQDLGNALNKNLAKGSPKKELASFLEKTPSVEVVDKILKTGNPDQMERLAKTFPTVFEAARTSKLAEIAQKAEYKGQIDPLKLSKAIQALEPESKVLLFGAEAAKKSDALKTYLNSLPGKLVGPSGTPEGIRWHDVMNIFNPAFYFRQAASLGPSIMTSTLTKTPLGTDLITTLGRTAQTPIAKIGTIAAAKAGAINPLLPKPLAGGQ